MNVQFLRFVNIFSDPLEDDISEEDLGDERFGGHKKPRSFIARIGGPGFGSCSDKEFLPLRHGRDQLERFR